MLTSKITNALGHTTELEKVYEKSNIGYFEWTDGTKAEIKRLPDSTVITFNNGLTGVVEVNKGTVFYNFTVDGKFKFFIKPFDGPKNEIQDEYYNIIKEYSDRPGAVLTPAKTYKSSDEIIKDQEN